MVDLTEEERADILVEIKTIVAKLLLSQEGEMMAVALQRLRKEYPNIAEFDLYERFIRTYFAPKESFSTLPTSPVLHNAKKFLANVKSDRDIRGSRDIKITSKLALNGKRSVNFKSRNGNITISIEKYEEIKSKQDKNTVKLMNFLLIKSNEQNHNPAITFNLKELVENGVYSSQRTAKAGFEKSIDKIISIKLNGTLTYGKKEIASRGGYIFYAWENKRGNITVRRDETVNLDFITQYITLIPNWAFSLNEKAYSLIDYIFYRARIEVSKIKKQGYFNMSLESINNHLGQHDIKDTERHKQLIIEPIKKAVEEISNANRGAGLKLTLVCEEGNIRDFLKGYLRVELKSKQKEYFIGLADKKDKIKAKNERVKLAEN